MSDNLAILRSVRRKRMGCEPWCDARHAEGAKCGPGPVTPMDFEHVEELDLDDDGTLAISLVRSKTSGTLFVEVLHGKERYLYAPVALDPMLVDSFDVLAAIVGTEAGR